MDDLKTALEDKGFINTTDNTWIYEFSDFEILRFEMQLHTKVNKLKCVKISKLKLYNPFTNEVYMEINYDLYFDNINKFYDLLTLIGYKLQY